LTFAIHGSRLVEELGDSNGSADKAVMQLYVHIIARQKLNAFPIFIHINCLNIFKLI